MNFYFLIILQQRQLFKNSRQDYWKLIFARESRAVSPTLAFKGMFKLILQCI